MIRKKYFWITESCGITVCAIVYAAIVRGNDPVKTKCASSADWNTERAIYGIYIILIV